jgi:hypothetical protein
MKTMLAQDPTVKATVGGLGEKLDIISGDKHMSDYVRVLLN